MPGALPLRNLFRALKMILCTKAFLYVLFLSAPLLLGWFCYQKLLHRFFIFSSESWFLQLTASQVLKINYAVLLSEWVSVTVTTESEAINKLCRFWSYVHWSLKLPRRQSFLQSIWQKFCLVTSSGPAWLNTIF